MLDARAYFAFNDFARHTYLALRYSRQSDYFITYASGRYLMPNRAARFQLMGRRRCAPPARFSSNSGLSRLISRQPPSSRASTEMPGSHFLSFSPPEDIWLYIALHYFFFHAWLQYFFHAITCGFLPCPFILRALMPWHQCRSLYFDNNNHRPPDFGTIMPTIRVTHVSGTGTRCRRKNTHREKIAFSQ